MPAAATKTYRTSLLGGLGGRQRRECWGAVTADGVWSIDRTEDVGTPWIITHVPTMTEMPGLYGTLKSALNAVANMEAMKWLP